MNERDLELTGLVHVRELLRRRGTDVSELERQIDRLTQPEAATRASCRAVKTRQRAAPGGTHRTASQLLT